MNSFLNDIDLGFELDERLIKSIAKDLGYDYLANAKYAKAYNTVEMFTSHKDYNVTEIFASTKSIEDLLKMVEDRLSSNHKMIKGDVNISRQMSGVGNLKPSQVEIRQIIPFKKRMLNDTEFVFEVELTAGKRRDKQDESKTVTVAKESRRR